MQTNNLEQLRERYRNYVYGDNVRYDYDANSLPIFRQTSFQDLIEAITNTPHFRRQTKQTVISFTCQEPDCGSKFSVEISS